MNRSEAKEYRSILRDYQVWATSKINPALTKLQLREYCRMKLMGELGEYLNLVAKFTYHGKVVATETLIDELGDVMWYVSLAATIRKNKLGSKLPVYSIEDENFSISEQAAFLTRHVYTLGECIVHNHSVSWELGLVIASVNDLAAYHGSDLYNVLRYNVSKLNARHEGGYNDKFYKAI